MASSITYSYRDLRTATLQNNLSIVSDWLQACVSDDEKDEWIGRLLGVAACHYSVDVLKCIIDYIKPLDNCTGLTL